MARAWRSGARFRAPLRPRVGKFQGSWRVWGRRGGARGARVGARVRAVPVLWAAPVQTQSVRLDGPGAVGYRYVWPIYRVTHNLARRLATAPARVAARVGALTYLTAADRMGLLGPGPRRRRGIAGRRPRLGSRPGKSAPMTGCARISRAPAIVGISWSSILPRHCLGPPLGTVLARRPPARAFVSTFHRSPLQTHGLASHVPDGKNAVPPTSLYSPCYSDRT